MRLYTFTNMYLSSIQQGIQPLHVLGEMIHLYNYKSTKPNSNSPKQQLIDWAKNHKTVICLNAGYGVNIETLYERFANQSQYPYAKFHEEMAALSGAITSTGIILPSHIYGLSSLYRQKLIPDYKLNSTCKLEESDLIACFNYAEDKNDYNMDDLLENLQSTIDSLTEFDVFIVKELNRYGLAK